MHRSLWLLATALATLAAPPAALGEGALTVEEAVQEALRNHPSLKAATARLEQAEAAHRALWEAYVPKVSAFSGIQLNQVSGSTTTTTPGGLLGGGNTVTQDFAESDTRFVAGAAIEEFLFDFGGFSGQRRAGDATRQAQMEALETQRLDVALNVRASYFELLRSNRLLRYNHETVERRQGRVQRISELVRRGVRDRKDLLQAQLDLANARLNLARTQSQITDVEATFLEAIGQESRTGRKLVDDVTLKPVNLTLPQAADRALNLRPELAQVRASIESQKATIESVRATFLPRVSAFGNLTSLTPTGSSDLDQLTVLSAGVSLSVPLDRAFTDARLVRAKATLTELEAHEAELRQRITLDVSRRYTTLFEAVERTRITQELADQALANFRETQNRYRKGRASITESTDAYVFLYDARVALIQALYDAKIAEARLERAIGTTL